MKTHSDCAACVSYAWLNPDTARGSYQQQVETYGWKENRGGGRWLCPYCVNCYPEYTSDGAQKKGE